MSVEFVNTDTVQMAKHTFMWVKQTHFTFDATLDDRAVMTELIACDAYDYDYCSPFPPVRRKRIHGRWRLDAIDFDRFHPISADDAVAVLHNWANEQEWTDSDFRQPEDAMVRLESVYALLRSGTVLRLDNPGDDALHGYGFVTGNLGFHEFVVLDRSSGSLHVIVATDD